MHLSDTEARLSNLVDRLATAIAGEDNIKLVPDEKWDVDLSTTPPTLYYRVADASVLTGDQTLTVIAHEMAHLLYTDALDFEALSWADQIGTRAAVRKLASQLIYAVEDARIERRFSKDFPGAESLFREKNGETRTGMWSKKAKRGFNSLPIQWKFLLNVHRILNGYGPLGEPELQIKLAGHATVLNDAANAPTMQEMADQLGPVFEDLIATHAEELRQQREERERQRAEEERQRKEAEEQAAKDAEEKARQEAERQAQQAKRDQINEARDAGDEMSDALKEASGERDEQPAPQNESNETEASDEDALGPEQNNDGGESEGQPREDTATDRAEETERTDEQGDSDLQDGEATHGDSTEGGDDASMEAGQGDSNQNAGEGDDAGDNDGGAGDSGGTGEGADGGADDSPRVSGEDQGVGADGDGAGGEHDGDDVWGDSSADADGDASDDGREGGEAQGDGGDEDRSEGSEPSAAEWQSTADDSADDAGEGDAGDGSSGSGAPASGSPDGVDADSADDQGTDGEGEAGGGESGGAAEPGSFGKNDYAGDLTDDEEGFDTDADRSASGSRASTDTEELVDGDRELTADGGDGEDAEEGEPAGEDYSDIFGDDDGEPAPDVRATDLLEEMVQDLRDDDEHGSNEFVKEKKNQMDKRAREARKLEKQIEKEWDEAAKEILGDIGDFSRKRIDKTIRDEIRDRLSENATRYNEIKAEVLPEIATLRRYSNQVLDENRRDRFAGSYTSGKRIKKRRLYRVMTQDPRLFERKTESGGRSYSVAVLIDQSSSMTHADIPEEIAEPIREKMKAVQLDYEAKYEAWRNASYDDREKLYEAYALSAEKMREYNTQFHNDGRDRDERHGLAARFSYQRLAMKASIIMAEAFEGLIDTTIIGFAATFPGPPGRNGYRTHGPQIRVYKRPTEKLAKRVPMLAEMDYSYGGTPLHPAVLAATDMLEAEETEVKAIVIVTDGVPHQEWACEEAIQRARQKGIEVYALGINMQTSDEIMAKRGSWPAHRTPPKTFIERNFDHPVNVKDAAEIPRGLLQVLRSIVKRNTAALV